MLLVPQPELERLQAATQSDRLNVEQLVFIVSLLQLVVRDARAQMVDVMETNVA